MKIFAAITVLSQLVLLVASKPHFPRDNSETSPQLQAYLTFLGAYTNKDYDAMAAQLTEDFIYTPMPKSLNQPQRNKTEFIAYSKGFRDQFVSTSGGIVQTTEQPGRVVLYIEGSGVTTNNRTFDNQYMVTAEIESVDGELKVATLHEFYDSLYLSQFIAGGQ
ncbi:hypothetical protein BKA62DRAFT_769076 [Auriculariales sp. MPI-PUGE-AT-0066]|nr:hypothetical protein BKA62DRAFT_769076 [Auriculariales sp. MPI-PUGE-AT-0066]